MSFSLTDTKSTQWVDPRLELKNKPTAVSVVSIWFRAMVTIIMFLSHNFGAVMADLQLSDGLYGTM